MPRLLAETLRRTDWLEQRELLRELAAEAGLDHPMSRAEALYDVFAVGDDHEPTPEVQMGGDPASVRSALVLCALGWLFLERRRVLWVAPGHKALAGAAGQVIDWLTASPDLWRLVRRASRSNGAATVDMHGDGRLMFRTLGGARGIAADKLIVDDAEAMPEQWRHQLVPCLMGRRGAQAVLGVPAR